MSAFYVLFWFSNSLFVFPPKIDICVLLLFIITISSLSEHVQALVKPFRSTYKRIAAKAVQQGSFVDVAYLFFLRLRAFRFLRLACWSDNISYRCLSYCLNTAKEFSFYSQIFL